MRKYILLIALCLHGLARGQTQGFSYLYWFDDDITTAEKGSTTSDAWQMEVDLSNLSESFHTIHLQVTDENNVSSTPVTRCFFLSREEGVLTDGFYWFDNEAQARRVEGDIQGALTFDVTELQEGFHSLHYQVLRADGLYSQIETRCFYKVQSDQIVGQLTFMCYIDGTPFKQERVSANNGVATWLLDVSDLPIGFHKLQVRAFLENGSSTTNCEAFFLRTAMPSELDAITCVCSIDGEVFKQERMEATNGSALWQLDVSELPIGFHRLQLRAVMENGASTSIREAFFLRNAMDSELNALSCVFSIDGLPYKTIESGVQDGVFHCELDVAELTDGLHKVAYTLTDGKGAQTAVKSQYFIKTPVGGNSIKKYQYWVNDNDDMAHVVVQEEVTDPLKLITLLPIEPQPLRSNLFQFDIKDGKPMMYAKNEIHLRFFDAAGRFTDASDQYVDYQVGQEVKPVGELLATQTFAKIAENDIRWYTMQAAPGDTVAFKLSQPATMQLFAPSGEEVFKTSESASVNWNGMHTWEKGTYYLAVHDVTGSQSTMKLEYMHMDKYDVVDWDVRRVGNGGCSTITFKGNGFRDLYAVDLYNAQGDSIRSVAVGFIDDANVSVTFNFTDAPLGNYDAVFHFTTEDKTFHNILTVEEATDIELALDVQYPSSFLRGTSTTYTITVTNKGNSTAYNVPMEIYLSAANSFADITSVKFKDEQGKEFNNFTLDMIAEKDSIDDETLAHIDELIWELDGLHTFIVKNDSTGEGEYGFTDQLISIAPNSSSTFYVEIKSSSTVNLKVRIPSKWITIHTESKVAQSRRKSNASESNLCCVKEKWECSVNIVANIIGLIPVAGCVSALADAAFFTTFEIACADGNTLGEKELEFYRSIANDSRKRQSVIDKSINGLLGCVAGVIGKAIKALKDRLAKVSKLADAASEAARIARERASEYRTLHEYYLAASEAERLLGHADEAEKYLTWAENAKRQMATYANEAANKEQELKSLWAEMKDLRIQIDEYNLSLAEFIENIKTGISTIISGSECVQEWKKAKANCPPTPEDDGGSSTPYTPVDPNDIYGYLSQAGSKFITDSVAKVNYTIEFENDTAFATAAAHSIVIKDTLDKKYFVLEEFMPIGVRIGDREVFLKETEVKTQNDVTSFVKTIDMRPEINAIAQVDGTFNSLTGIAQWTFQSLDPMTMEPTNDLMQGILPVNFDGTSGIGEVMFEIGVKQGKADGAEIKNRASIVFDFEDAIITPTWTNIVDAVAPSSVIDNSWMVNDSTLRITAEAFDARSGVWKYEWYVQAGENAPWWKEGETDSLSFDYHIYEGIDYGFCVVATDSAGNVEQKVVHRERGFKTYGQDYEDTIIDVPADSNNDAPDAIYDLSGRKQAEPQENRVNIVGKKKILFRRNRQ